MSIGHSKEARSTNFIFNIGHDRELSFAAQTSSVADITLGETFYYSGAKDLKIPSNKITNAPLTVDFLLSEDLHEWVEIYKWLLLSKNLGHNVASRPCELQILNSQSQPSVSFLYMDVFPMELSGVQYALNTESSTVLAFTATFAYNKFRVQLNNGSVIDENYVG